MTRMAIFVPHQDDETNLVGNILAEFVKEYEVFIVYSSLDTDKKKAEIRIREAIAACGVYGIDKSHITFLGFSDTPNKAGHHFYTDGDESITDRLYEILIKIKPEIIIGTDFDFHSDHRMLSLALDDAVRRAIKTIKDYYPEYLKGFCYDTAYYGVDDYSASSLGEMRINGSLLGNPSYRWENRISIKSNQPNGFIFNKLAYKALSCHKSQHAILHARSVINADNVFWQKRTDNLLLKNAKVTTSSGNVSKLCDLKVIDTDDIITMDPLKIDFSKGLWIPNETDRNPWIKIEFGEEKTIEQIVLHGDPNNADKTKCEIELLANDNRFELNYLQPYGQESTININAIKCSCILIAVHTRNPISEIEVFESIKDSFFQEYKYHTKPVCCKSMDYIDSLIYKGIVFKEKIQRKLNEFKHN